MEVFLDSGAFSAHTKGVEIKIEDYISFIKKHRNIINIYSNLDVIKNPKQTWKNQITMEKAGLLPPPVYHFGESIKWLERYLNRNKYNYISLGGMVGIPNKYLIRWLDNLFSNYLTNNKGIPNIKIHGFGISRIKLIMRYPWYSIDSTSAVRASGMGCIYVPHAGKNYNMPYTKIVVSSRSVVNNKHIQGISTIKKKIVKDYIKQTGYKLGRSIIKKGKEIIKEKGLCNDYSLRTSINFNYLQKVEEHSPKWPWAFKISTRNFFTRI